MKLFKTCRSQRQRAIGLVLLGVSFAILAVPTTLTRWSSMVNITDDQGLIGLIIVYILLAGFVLYKSRRAL